MITVLGKRVTMAELEQMPVIRPEKAGSRWMGIPHYSLAATLQRCLSRRGIGVKQEVWALDASGQSLAGGLEVEFPASLGMPELTGMSYSLGVRHANNLRHPLTFAVGTRIMVCSNGVVSGTWVLCRKHTTGLDLEAEIEGGVTRFLMEARQVRDCITLMRGRELSQPQADNLLMEAGRQRLLPWSGIGKAQDEYTHPAFPDFSERTFYSLYNAFNSVVKGISPQRQFHALNRFREIGMN